MFFVIWHLRLQPVGAKP